MQTNLTIRVAILFAVVSAIALSLPSNSAVDSQGVTRADLWGSLPLKVTLKASQ